LLTPWQPVLSLRVPNMFILEATQNKPNFIPEYRLSKAPDSILSQRQMIVGSESSYWILHHDHWNGEALRTFSFTKEEIRIFHFFYF